MCAIERGGNLRTVAILVQGAGVSFSVVVCVRLSRVVVVGTVIAAVSYVVLIKVILQRVVLQGTVVLERRESPVNAPQWKMRDALVYVLLLAQFNPCRKKVLPAHPQCHRCHHLCHRHLPGHHCHSPPGLSWEA